ncbi:MAG: GntR family transcriptional regulator [Alphaproteobacteria bacterium]
MALQLDLDRTTVADEILALLRDRIVRGELTPGTRLSENEIALELGVSRTPVREAFIQLREQSLLRILPQRGSFVAPINLGQVEDSYFLRETVEFRTVGIAAENCTPEHADQLRSIIDRQRTLLEDGSDSAFVKADDAMHRYFVEMCGRPSIWKVVSAAKVQIDRLRCLNAQDQATRERIVSDHQRIVQAVIGNEVDAAVAAMQHHLRNIHRNIERLAKEYPGYMDGQAFPSKHRPRHKKPGSD